MKDIARVLIVANRTAATPALLEAVRARADRGPTSFDLVVPASPNGLHRIVDPEDHGREEAELNLRAALPRLSVAARSEVGGHVGDPNPVAAVQDAVYAGQYDEIIVSTLPSRVSRWISLDLPSKVRGLGLPVLHVQPDAVDACVLENAQVAVG
jgi:hypothetical protein